MGLFERTKKIKDQLSDDYSIGKVNMLNQKVGLWETFDEKNVLKQKETFSSDHSFGEKRKGPFEYYHFDTNMIRVKGTYDHEEFCDFRIGICFHYYKTGELHTICNYKKHYRTDNEIDYLHDTGRTTEKIWVGSLSSSFSSKYYKTDSVVDGPLVQFYKDGSVMLESYITSHDPDGNGYYFSHLMSPFVIYDKQGSVLKKGQLYSSGEYGLRVESDYSFYGFVDSILDKDFRYYSDKFNEEQFRLFQKDCKKLGGY